MYQDKYRFVLCKDNEISPCPPNYVGNDADLFYQTYRMLRAYMSSGILNIGPLGSHALIKTMLVCFISFVKPFVGVAPELVTQSFLKESKNPLE